MQNVQPYLQDGASALWALYRRASSETPCHGSRPGLRRRGEHKGPRRKAVQPSISSDMLRLEEAARAHFAAVAAAIEKPKSTPARALRTSLTAQQLLPAATSATTNSGAAPPALHEMAAALRACSTMAQAAALLVAHRDASRVDATLLAPSAAAVQLSRRALGTFVYTCSHTPKAQPGRIDHIRDILLSLARMTRAPRGGAPPDYDAMRYAAPRVQPMGAADATELLQEQEIEPVVQQAAWLLHESWLALVSASHRAPEASAALSDMRSIGKALAAFAHVPPSPKLDAYRAVVVCRGAHRAVSVCPGAVPRYFGPEARPPAVGWLA